MPKAAAIALNKFLFLLIFFPAVLLLPPALAHVQHAHAHQDIEAEIEARQEQISRHKMALERLSSQERELYSQLAETEDRLDEVSEKLSEQEQQLFEIKDREAVIYARYQQLILERENTRGQLAELLRDMWPIYVESRSQTLADIGEWAQLDRRRTWLQAIHTEVNNTLALLHEQTLEISSSLNELQIVRNEFEAGLEEVNSLKDQLLDKKLTFFRGLQEVRAQKLAEQEMIEETMEVIESLSYQLQITAEQDFESLKGYLPWPALGEIALSYNSSGNPPHNGISISLPENAPVRAISWGKVVHNATLRGFGRVVIIFHGEGYYSLYAYLADSGLSIGQNVEQGETIGITGYYPQLKSHGIYFELRFEQKAINPINWLVKS